MKNININSYNTAEIAIHKAAQIIAFLGKHLGKEQADDSHTTMEYSPEKSALVGKEITINATLYKAEIRLKNYDLALVSNEVSKVFNIEGQTISAIFQEVKKSMEIDELPDFKLHYALPESYDIANYQLKQPPIAVIMEWGNLRQTAAEVFELFNTIISPPSSINIWPHHFDTGTYHVLAKNEEGDRASIGAGLAVADTIVNEPYFYIYAWAKDKKIDYPSAPKLSFGEWKTGNWNGAIVPLSKVMQLSNVKSDLKIFFEETSQFLKSQIL